MEGTASGSLPYDAHQGSHCDGHTDHARTCTDHPAVENVVPAVWGSETRQAASAWFDRGGAGRDFRALAPAGEHRRAPYLS